MIEPGQSGPYPIDINFLLLLILMSDVDELWNTAGEIDEALEDGALTYPLIISM